MSNGVDPKIAAILPKLPWKDAANLTPKRARDELVALVARADSRKDVPLRQPASVQDILVDGAAGSIPARMYAPATSPSPTVMYFHGGGWVAGDLHTHDGLARTLCLDLDAVVVSVDYRRAPEVRFPGAFDDCLAATRWAAENISKLGGDGARLGVAGDSSGGALAGSVAQAWRTAAHPLKAQLLIYPSTDLAGMYASESENGNFPSRIEYADGYFLTTDALRFFSAEYLSRAEDGWDWRASPLRATSLKGLPPIVICTAEFDPVRDEGDAYASALRDAGVEVAHFRESGMIHAYFRLGAVSPAAESARLRACTAFKQMLL